MLNPMIQRALVATLGVFTVTCFPAGLPPASFIADSDNLCLFYYYSYISSLIPLKVLIRQANRKYFYVLDYDGKHEILDWNLISKESQFFFWSCVVMSYMRVNASVFFLIFGVSAYIALIY